MTKQTDVVDAPVWDMCSRSNACRQKGKGTFYWLVESDSFSPVKVVKHEDFKAVCDELIQSRQEVERLQDMKQRLDQWCEAYPLDMFPEPDFKKAGKVLKENGMTLDAISASNFRHVLSGVMKIIANN